jgi:DUF4097 and DUF4098 domain-containing protein YvlB
MHAKTGSILVLAAAFVAAAAGPAAGVVIDREFHESFDVKEGHRLSVEHGDGDVTITPWDKDVIDVEVIYHAEITSLGFGDDPDFTVEFKETDDGVFVTGYETSPDRVDFFRAVKERRYTYTISAPSYIVINLRGDDGDIEIEGWRGDISVDLDDGDVTLADVVNTSTRVLFQDGDIEIDGLEGELTLSGDDGDIDLSGVKAPYARISLQDGDIDVDSLEGEIEIDVDDGDITLENIRSERVELRGQDGTMDVGLLKVERLDLDVATDDGDIEVVVNAAQFFEFLITMDDGDVEVALPNVSGFSESDHRVAGVHGTGDGRVRIRTNDGNVVVRAAD